MKLKGYIFTPKQDVLGSYIFSKIALYAKYSNYTPYEYGEPTSLQIWVTPLRFWFIKRFLKTLTNLEYTLEEI